MASSAKQQKLDGFFIKKQTNNGINTDLTQTVPTISDTNEEGPNEEVENEKIMKSFQTKWLKEHHWLRYDEEKNMMFCSICLDYNKDNASFCVIHKQVVSGEVLQGFLKRPYKAL